LLEWGIENGLKYKSISMPANFGKSGFFGVVANEYIPPNTVILAVPNKLILSS